MHIAPEHLDLLSALRKILAERFSVEELQTLCFEMGIEYEDLSGQGKAGKARELVGYLDRRDLIRELISVGERLRPDIQWGQLPASARLATLPASSPPPPGMESKRPIRILFLAANPSDTSPLRLGAEIREIEHALRLTEFRDRFVIEQQWAVRVSDLQDHLLRYRPDIVHFSGHGSAASEIILEDHLGYSKPISPPALSKLFNTLRDNIKCVVLNACYSEVQAEAIAKHIDCVIGMHHAIGDLAAVNFATAFYRGLGYGKDLATAFNLGVGQIDLEGLDEQDTPRLLASRKRPEEIIL